MTIFRENSSEFSGRLSCTMGMENPASVAPAGKSTCHVLSVKSEFSEKEHARCKLALRIYCNKTTLISRATHQLQFH